MLLSVALLNTGCLLRLCSEIMAYEGIQVMPGPCCS
jgi:hypothetical protein